MDKTRVFVSSTCFDLGQVRRDLETFIVTHGFEPLLSDSPSIVVPSGLNAIEACKFLVQSAQLFVLIIGGRYGSADLQSGNSITSLEYETALEAGIPIVPFVDREVWMKRDVYRSLRELQLRGELSEGAMAKALGEKVQDPRVFEFIERVSSAPRDNWIREFTNADEIISALKSQWSALFREQLLVRQKESSLLGGPKDAPVLSLLWVGTSGPVDTLDVPVRNIPTQGEVLEQLDALRPSDGDIDLVRKIGGKYVELVPKAGPTIGMFPTGRDEPKEVIRGNGIDVVLGYQKEMDLIIQKAKDDFAGLTQQVLASSSAFSPTFQVANTGRSLAKAPIVFVKPSARVRFLSHTAAIEQTLTIPKSQPAMVMRALAQARTGEAPRIGRTDPLADMLNVSADWVKPVDFPRNIFGPIAKEPVSLEDGSIRIDVQGDLRHYFVKTYKCTDVLVCTDLRPGETLGLKYSCFAENLPEPTSGELLLRGIPAPLPESRAEGASAR